MSQPPRITLIAGPTASGKSALALRMARETGAVIINADSQQLYADLRVLTARPSEDEEAMADHRLYGVADAAEAWSVGRWSRAVLGILQEEDIQDRPVILVGGTGLYFAALTEGLAEIPPIPEKVRDAVEMQFREQGEDTFRARLTSFDPRSAQTIQKGDRQRLIRAMSVAIHTGRSINSWKLSTNPLFARDSWRSIVLNPDRNELYARCDARSESMLAAGALDEVESLLSRRINFKLPVMKVIGLREIQAHLEGKLSLNQASALIKKATRNYAKRQLTWFRKRNLA